MPLYSIADRAKAIKTVATVNESPTEKLIRELREENKKLMEMLKKSGMVVAGLGEAEGGEEEGSEAGGGGSQASSAGKFSIHRETEKVGI